MDEDKEIFFFILCPKAYFTFPYVVFLTSRVALTINEDWILKPAMADIQFLAPHPPF